MRYLLIFFLSFFFIVKAQAYADFSTIEWCKGAIILNSHEVITGEVSYNAAHDIVLHRAEGRVQTFTAAQINYFHFISNPIGVVRRFVALPHYTHFNFLYKRSFFFEILLSGEITFLRKSNKHRGFTHHAQKPMKLAKMNLDNIGYDYFMLHEEKLLRIKNFEKDALPMLTLRDSKSIHNYIDAKKITKFTPYNQLIVIHFYNTILAKEDRRLVQRTELGE